MTDRNEVLRKEPDPVWMNDVIPYKPTYWIPGPEHVGGIHRCDEGVTSADEEGETRLYVTDSLFNYYILDDDCDTPVSDEEFNLDKRLANVIASKLNDKIGFHPLRYNTPPVWSKIRDRSSVITGGVISNKELFQKHLKSQLGNAVFISAQGWDPEDEALNDFGHLMYLAQNSARLIEDCLADDLTARQAIDFMKETPTGRVSYRNIEYVKWFKEAEILDVHLRMHKTFQCNFNTIVITDTAKVAAKHGINWNSLYRLIAQLGRNNTRLVILD